MPEYLVDARTPLLQPFKKPSAPLHCFTLFDVSLCRGEDVEKLKRDGAVSRVLQGGVYERPDLLLAKGVHLIPSTEDPCLGLPVPPVREAAPSGFDRDLYLLQAWIFPKPEPKV